MHAQRLPDGRLVVPMRAEGPDTVGDALVVIDATHPDFAAWDRHAVDADERLTAWAEGRPSIVSAERPG